MKERFEWDGWYRTVALKIYSMPSEVKRENHVTRVFSAKMGVLPTIESRM